MFCYPKATYVAALVDIPFHSNCNFACTDNGTPACGYSRYWDYYYEFDCECDLWRYSCNYPSDGNLYIFYV